MLDWLGNLGSIALVVVGLGFLIFIHEFGHFLMAKRNKVRVEVFSLGFGQPIWKWRRGETEYRVSWIPLGGYVKMAGETMMDERHGEPWELTSKGAWPRLQIFTAGALMNLLIAFPIVIIAFLVGLHQHAPIVGVPGMAESLAGIEPGDEVVEVDGKTIENLDKFRIEMVRRSNGQKVPVTVIRDGERKTYQVETRSSPYHNSQAALTSVEEVRPESQFALKGVQAGDEIAKVNGRTIVSLVQLQELVTQNPGQILRLDVRRWDTSWNRTEFPVEVTVPSRDVFVLPVEDTVMEAAVGGTVPGSPAHGKLQRGDVIRAIDRKEIRSWAELRQIVEQSVRTPLRIEVLRDSKSESLEIVPAHGGASFRGSLGIMPKLTNVFAHVPEGSYLAQHGILSGDKLVFAAPLRGPEGKWEETGQTGELFVRQLMGLKDKEQRTLEVKVERRKDGKTETLSFTLPMERRAEGDMEALGVKNYGHLRPYRRRGMGDAIVAGLYEPYDIAILTLDVLKKLLMGGESMTGLSGPVGIFTVSYRSTKLSFGNFLWLLCLITVNLGVFNLLPIPILDGGHVVLLAIEKLRGRPPTEKFVASFQYVGLLFILALVVFVTYNDISRIFTGG